MSSTTTTQFYGLTQYIGTDKPDFADNNTAFRNVDADLHQVVQDSQSFSSDIAELTQAVGDLNTDLTNLSGDLDGEKAKITALQNKELSQDTEIARVERNAQDMVTAYNEASATSTHAYAVGDYFIYNNVLYQATAAIAVGATIVPDTNCTTTNVTSELIQLNSDLADTSFKVIKSVTADGVKTWTELLTELGYPTGAKECIETVYQNGAVIFTPQQLVDAAGHHYVNIIHDTSQFKITELVVGAVKARYSFVATSGGNTITDTSSAVPPSGMTISFIR